MYIHLRPADPPEKVPPLLLQLPAIFILIHFKRDPTHTLKSFFNARPEYGTRERRGSGDGAGEGEGRCKERVWEFLKKIESECAPAELALNSELISATSALSRPVLRLGGEKFIV
jgi:hypothetical protein